MIIKKKYTTNINPKIDAPEEINYINNNELQEGLIEEENVQELEEETDDELEKVEVEETGSEPKGFSLDLSIDDIKFEQRPERREGSRRRGYRRTQDRNIVSRAQKDAQLIKEAAKQDGYKEGLNQANQDIENLRSKLVEFYGYKELVFEKVSECILDISVEIARKIINKQIETDNSTIISIIKAAVNEVNKSEEKITLKVMPKDVELVRDKIPEIFPAGSFDAKILVIPDNSIQEGGVIIETSNGIIDATIETQLSIIEKTLKTQEDSKET